MRVTLNEVSSHLFRILTLIIVKTYLQTGRSLYRIARRAVVTCYNSAKLPETPKNFRKCPKTHSFSAGSTTRNGLVEMIPNFQHKHPYSPFLTCFKYKMIMYNIFRIK